MPVPTKTVRGLGSIVNAVEVLCRVMGLFYPLIRPKLSDANKAIFDALNAACQAFIASLPIEIE